MSTPAYCNKQIPLTGKRKGSGDVSSAPALGDQCGSTIKTLVPDSASPIVVSQFRIDYRSGEDYEPDFVVETKTRLLICEVKAQNELDDATVKAKTAAATKWCKTATKHTPGGGTKPWVYLLLPDDQIRGHATVDGLVAKFATS